METLIYFTLEVHKSAGGLIPTPARAMAGRSIGSGPHNMHLLNEVHRRVI